MTNSFPSRPPLGELAPSARVTAHKKAEPPKLGEAFGDRWMDHNNVFYRLPGGGIVQFDLNKLTLDDFRQMRDHYQVNASLAVLSFMMHQLDWKIVSDNPKVAAFCENNMRQIWSRLVRALSQAFWAGYSPCILQWENAAIGRGVVLTKVKDLVPELCDVNWKEIEGWSPPGYPPPKLRVYDGIKQFGLSWPIPAENTLWYSLLKENDNWYGKKLLRPAFTPWYFSLLIHMFANRYMERFGEPLPMGRAPTEVITNADSTKTTGTARMASILQNLRNRSVVVLPDDRSQVGNEVAYDYQIEYLESQMRGADFERYLMRLDEEISLALFTPLLILRTADVGSYNLGTGHWNLYQQMLNALAGDWSEYIDRYILGPMVQYNFGVNAKRAYIKFRKLGDDKQQLVVTLLQALIASGKASPDIAQLGEIAGLTVSEVKDVTESDEPANTGTDDATDEGASGTNAARRTSQNRRLDVAEIQGKIASRVAGQIAKALQANANTVCVDLGYAKQLDAALGGGRAAEIEVTYAVLGGLVSETYPHSKDSDQLCTVFSSALDNEVRRLLNER